MKFLRREREGLERASLSCRLLEPRHEPRAHRKGKGLRLRLLELLEGRATAAWHSVGRGGICLSSAGEAFIQSTCNLYSHHLQKNLGAKSFFGVLCLLLRECIVLKSLFLFREIIFRFPHFYLDFELQPAHNPTRKKTAQNKQQPENK